MNLKSQLDRAWVLVSLAVQELSEEKKRLEKELEEQKKFIAAVKSSVSHL